MTDSEVTQYIRSLVNEDSASFWSDADITLYKKVGMSLALANFFPFIYELKKKNTLKSPGTGSPSFTLPDDYYRVGRLEIASSGKMLRYIQDDEYYKYAEWGSDSPVAWMYVNGGIDVIPTPSGTLANYLRLWYMPKLIAIADFPDALHPLIAVEAIISAKHRDEDVTPDLIELRKHYYDAAEIDFAMMQLQEPIGLRDYGLEDQYA